MNYLSFITTPAPTVAVGIDAGRVAAISVSRPSGGGVLVGASAVEPLPPGAVVPGLAAVNVADRAAVVAALRGVFQTLGVKPRRIGLVIPDTAGKVSIIKLDKVPTRTDDLDQLIRFNVRKSAPFRLEEAQVSFTQGAAAEGGGREFVVVVARRDIVGEYEAACHEAGAQAGLVDLATPNVVNMVLATAEAPAGDWLLVHVASDYATMAILRGGDLIFFRTRSQESDGNLADLAHQTAMYYEDRLGGTGFDRVLLAGVGPDPAGAASAEALRRSLESRLGMEVACPEPGRFARFSDRPTIDAASFAAFAPLIGLLSRQAVAA